MVTSRPLELVADYGPGDPAFAELVRRLELALGDVTVHPTRVAGGDTLAAGLCVAQLALAPGAAGRIVVHDVAPPGAEERRVCAGRTASGALVVGCDAGWCWSFVADALRSICALELVERATPRDRADTVAKVVVRAVDRHPHAVREPIPRAAMPSPPCWEVTAIDREGNVETTIAALPAPAGWRVVVRVGDVSAPARVSDGTVDLDEGELALSSGALTVQGGSAAERFGDPRPGAEVELRPTAA